MALLNEVRSAFQAGGEGSELRHLLEAPPAFIELLPMAAYACDGAGRLLWFNELAAELWGRSPRLGHDGERFCGSYRLFFDGREVMGEETPMAQAIRTGEAVRGKEGVIERPDGSRVRAMVHILAVKDADGAVVGAINCFHDTSELRGAHEELRERQLEHQQLLQALPAAIYTTDADGRITYYNKAAVDLSGREPELGTDKWCVTWRLYTTDGVPLPHDECPMAVALKEGRPIRNAEAVAERPDGTLVPFIPYPTPLYDGAGRLIGAVNMLVDISERKQAESRQIMLLKELNHRVKNNMQMLQSLLSSAQRETANPEARAVLADATRRVAAMAAAQQVLYEEHQPAMFSADDFLQSVCATAQTALGENATIVIEPATGTLSNDVAMPLALILNELLTNAAKYAAADNGNAVVHVGLADQGDDDYQLWVHDGGPGFELAKAKRKRASGLGLVDGLARQLGGSLAVEQAGGARCVVRFRQRGQHQNGKDSRTSVHP